MQGQGQKSEQKHTTESFDEFHNHSPLLTMFNPMKKLYPRGLHMPGGVIWNVTQLRVLFVSGSFAF